MEGQTRIAALPRVGGILRTVYTAFRFRAASNLMKQIGVGQDGTLRLSRRARRVHKRRLHRAVERRGVKRASVLQALRESHHLAEAAVNDERGGG